MSDPRDIQAMEQTGATSPRPARTLRNAQSYRIGPTALRGQISRPNKIDPFWAIIITLRTDENERAFLVCPEWFFYELVIASCADIDIYEHHTALGALVEALGAPLLADLEQFWGCEVYVEAVDFQLTDFEKQLHHHRIVGLAAYRQGDEFVCPLNLYIPPGRAVPTGQERPGTASAKHAAPAPTQPANDVPLKLVSAAKTVGHPAPKPPAAPKYSAATAISGIKPLILAGLINIEAIDTSELMPGAILLMTHTPLHHDEYLIWCGEITGYLTWDEGVWEVPRTDLRASDRLLQQNLKSLQDRNDPQPDILIAALSGELGEDFEVDKLVRGDTIRFDSLDPTRVDLLRGDVPIAHGEIVRLKDGFAVRVTRIPTAHSKGATHAG